MQPKKWCLSHKFFYILFSVTQLFLLGFSWSFDNISASNRKTQPSVYQFIWDNYIIFGQNCYNSTTLCQYGLFIHIYVFKNASLSKATIFYLLWYNVIRWGSHMYKKSLFHLFHSLLLLMNNTREVIK